MAIVFTQSLVTSLQHDLSTGQWGPTSRRFFDEVVTNLNVLLAAVPLTMLRHEGDAVRAMTQDPAEVVTQATLADVAQTMSEGLAALQGRVTALEERIDRLIEDLGN